MSKLWQRSLMDLSCATSDALERDAPAAAPGALQNVGAFLQVGLPADAVTRAGARPRFSVGGSNLTYERLSTVFPGQQLDAVAIQVPGGHQAETIAHPGEEWIYVVAGQ